MTYKHRLTTSGFPRSGNVFLNFALKELYFNEDVSEQSHMVLTLKENPHSFVPIRNPEDAIASWNLAQKDLPLGSNLDDDIKFYIRFHTYVLENIHTLNIMDFNKFSVDIEYIKNKVYSATQIEPIKNTTIEEIKSSILETGRVHNLPRDNKDELEIIKNKVIDHLQFGQCKDLYTNILLTQ